MSASSAPSTELPPGREKGRGDATPTGGEQTGTSSWERFKEIRSPGRSQPRMYRPGRERASTGQKKLHPYDPHPPDAHGFTLQMHGVRVDRDYYALLGVPREAPLEHIEWAYRCAVRVIHPDQYYLDHERRTACEAKLRTLNVAMKVLPDPHQRACYDAAWRWA